MTTKTSRSKVAFLAAALAGSLLSLPQISLAMAGGSAAIAAGAQDQSSDVVSAAKSKLNKSQFKGVEVSVDPNTGIATLSGSVDLYEYSADAQRRVSKV